jgi:hypothetical protein
VYIKKNLEYAIKKSFQIVLLVSNFFLSYFYQFLSNGYKRLKILIHIFH